MNSGQNEDNDLLGNGETSKESSSNDLNLSASATTVYTGAQRAALQVVGTQMCYFMYCSSGPDFIELLKKEKMLLDTSLLSRDEQDM